MHTFGHVLIWLIALGALAATALTGKTYDVRNSWLEKVDKLEQQVEANKPVIAEKEAKLRSLQADRDRLNLGWQEPFQNVQGQLAGDFRFSTNDPALVGWLAKVNQTQQGMDATKRSAPVVYLFQPQPDGSSVYAGSFQLATPPTPGQGVTFIPTWTPRPGDFATIGNNGQGPFRVRPMVPAQFPSKYTETRSKMIITERSLAQKQSDLADQKLREADAQAILDARNAELQGPDGLVTKTQKAEDARNTQLEKLDYWRRQVKDAELKVKALLDETRKLEQQLEQSPTEEKPSDQVVLR
ncbi:MAG: hypothetical protein KDA84_01360 [Planctomycetaceae bacterium]|nr:hypothetical protein [Planctomycetaceae bacterium]